jgi:HPt (histidine-containing phosphotransfer) domain-containing protein
LLLKALKKLKISATGLYLLTRHNPQLSAERKDKMSKFIYTVRFLQTLVVIFLTGYVASAQLMPGMVDMRPSINTSINNTINTARTEALSNSSNSSAVRVGEQKIRAGKANTTFNPSVAGTRRMVQSLQWTGKLARATVQEKIAHVNEITNRFNKMMLENKLTVNDLVDARVFSYAIASTIENNKKPSPEYLNRMRRNMRQYFLNNAFYQGNPDSQKQEIYEMYGLFTIQAVDHIEKLKTARTSNEKETARKDALVNTQAIMRELRNLNEVCSCLN